MESPEETIRLEVKTDPDAVRKQANWCGIRPGLRVLDAGCGPGKTTAILYEMIKPDGTMLGVDYSEERIRHAEKQYGRKSGIDFQVRDLRDPLEDLGPFDLIWVRFVLEYNRIEGPEITKNLTACLKPGGHLCLMDLDHNALNHYGLPAEMERILFELMAITEEKYNFDPFVGRKLYSYLYDLDYQDIRVDLMPHHLIYGKLKNTDAFNWIKKAQAASILREAFEKYPGGYETFYADFFKFFNDPRRFTYTPLILCRGTRPFPA